MNIAVAVKMIHGNAVFIREAKQTKNTHQYAISTPNLLLSTAIISQSTVSYLQNQSVSDRQTDRHTDRQTQTDRHTYRHTHRQKTDRQTDRKTIIPSHV